MKGSTFNQLTIFQAIVKEGSIRAAARKLEIAPPSVSQALKQLESSVGLPLFTRSTRHIELTEAGRLLHDQISEAINTLDFAVETVKDLSEQPSGKVSITLPRFVYQSFFRPIYAEFCQRYPEIKLEISISDKTVNLLEDGYDMGIRFGDKLEPGVVAHQLTPPLKEALFASTDYIKAHGAPKKIEDLQDHKVIQYRFTTSNQLAPLSLMQNKQSLRIDMPTALIVNDTDAIVDAAKKGIGIGKVLIPAVETELKNKELHPILEKHWHEYSGMYLYFLQNTQKAKRIRVLIDFLLEKISPN